MPIASTVGTGGLLAETEVVAAMNDPVARNLRITQLYHELELAMADVFASDDLSWCAYGVWASRQVGDAMQGLPTDHVRSLLDDPGFIGNLALPPDLDRWARRLLPVAQRVPDSLLAAVLDALQPNLARALGQGNHRVFTELAPTFAGFVDLVHDTDGDPDAIEARLPHLYERLGHVTYPGGAGYELTVLCDCYLRAIRSADPHERAQLIFYANLRGAHYEQQRVQGPLEDVTDVILELPASAMGQAGAVGSTLRALDRAAPRTTHRVRHTIGAVVGNTVTDIAVRVNTPVDDLAVGDALRIEGSGASYPPDLRELDLPEFRQFLQHPDDWMSLGPEPAAEIRVDNWVNYHERMPFIAHVMRMRQQSTELRQPPFPPGDPDQATGGSEPAEVVEIDLRRDGVTDLTELIDPR